MPVATLKTKAKKVGPVTLPATVMILPRGSKSWLDLVLFLARIFPTEQMRHVIP